MFSTVSMSTVSGHRNSRAERRVSMGELLDLFGSAPGHAQRQYRGSKAISGQNRNQELWRVHHPMPKCEILHSGQYWQDLRRRAKEAKAARAQREARTPSTAPSDSGHVFTFVPGRHQPYTGLVQSSGKVVSVSNPEATLQEQARVAQLATQHKKCRQAAEADRVARANRLQQFRAHTTEWKSAEGGEVYGEADRDRTAAVAVEVAGGAGQSSSQLVPDPHPPVSPGGAGQPWPHVSPRVPQPASTNHPPFCAWRQRARPMPGCRRRLQLSGSSMKPRPDSNGVQHTWREIISSGVVAAGLRSERNNDLKLISDDSGKRNFKETHRSGERIQRCHKGIHHAVRVRPPFSDNVDGDPEEQPPVILPTSDEDEKAQRDSIQKKLRLKLSNYFRNRWRAKKVHSAAIAGILGAMQTMSRPGSRPRRKPNLAVYSKLQYATRVKPQFDLVWANAKKTTPWTERVSMSQDYTRACWEKESPEFKAEIEAEGIKMHQADLEQWKASRKIPEGSAEEYHKYVTLEERQEIDQPSSSAMDSLNEVAIPLADALAERLGSHVVIRVVGPVGSEKGEVCLRTVFSDTSNLQTSRTWAQFDHGGFTAMENSITRYGRAAFIPPATVPPGPAAPIANITPIPASTIPTLNPAPVSSSITPTITPPPCSKRPTTMALIVQGGLKVSLKPMRTSLRRIGGPRWTALLDALVAHKWSWFHVDKEGKLPKLKSRPEEFADWMKEHRPCKDYPVGTDFGDQLLDWWKDLGVRAVGLVSESICNRAVADGIGADEAALAASKPFQLLVDDVTWVLKDVLTQDRPAAEEWLADKARREREEEDDAEEMGNATEKEEERMGMLLQIRRRRRPQRNPRRLSRGSRWRLPRNACSKRGEDGDIPAAKKADIGQGVQAKPRPKPRLLTRRWVVVHECIQQMWHRYPVHNSTQLQGQDAVAPAEKSQNVVPNSVDISAALLIGAVVNLGSGGGAIMATPLMGAHPNPEINTDTAGHFQERESLDSDPFAGGIGLTAEELAEMALDPDADNNAFDGDDMDTD
ncbi:hypothetical protein B0H14DRAFT_2609490 [Mycena olivaceomarginata]|nr:hypothetical protein B0H14DRAFT_2609490 [Mycena olivaceomarginata]